MKGKFKVALTVFILLMLSCSAFAVETNRYVVLILDTSGSMWGEPEEVQRESAKKFCQQILNAEGDNHVALVSLNSYASIICQFTKELDELISRIDTLDASGGTNINESLKLAGGLLEGITSQGAVKNIVLCSDGLPESGEWQEGRYSYTDYDDYGYANAAYNTAKDLREKKYNIYTLGFFHSLDGEYLEFGRRFMKDLASDGSYYEVTDVEKLEFTFGEIADDVVSDDKSVNTPIIIIPGIMGSRLFMSNSVFNEEQKAWDPTVTNAKGETDIPRTLREKIGLPSLGLLNRRLNLSSDVYVRPCENQNVDLSSRYEGNTVYQYGREYGAQNAYEELVKFLCEEYASGDKYRPIYFFNYDWRKSNADSAVSLDVCIQNILEETGAKKVNLVCHSMGGLVASKYYADYGSDQIDYIITCGTPYEGAPKLINSVMHWNVLGEGLFKNLERALEDSLEGTDTFEKIFEGIFTGIKNGIIQSASDFLLGCLGWMNKDLKTSFMGVTELLPTENYVTAIPMWKDSWKPFSWGDYQISFAEYQEICRKEFPGYDSAHSFQNSLKDNNYNKLLEYDKSYFILGINQKTITAIKYQFTNNNVDQKLYEEDLAYSTKGDGTVPYFSASICEQLNNLGIGRVLSCDTDHGGVVKEPDCLDWIVGILNKKPTNVSGSSMRSDGYIVVRIACPVDVTISNPEGEELNSSLENFTSMSSFGRLDIIGLSDDIKMVCIENSPNFSILLNGTDTGTMDYDIRYFDGNDEIYKEDSFRDIPITASTIIKTGTDGTKTTVLEVDNDGDGEIDDYLVPRSSMGIVTVTKQPENQTVYSGESAIFTVEASGSNLRYQWNVNRQDGRGWTLINGATGSEYVSEPANLLDDGNEYHCLITNAEGHTVSTNAATLHVYNGGRINNGSSGGGCEVSVSWASMMMLLGIIKLTKKSVS